MTLLTALLIDDEKRAVALLKKLLEETGAFSVIRYAFSASAALEILKKSVPDIIFLDVKMPNKDGFAFLTELKNLNISVDVVFVTAFDQYTFQAIKHHAFDYLLKPVVREELMSCIAGYKARKGQSDVSSRLHHFLADYEINRKIRFSTRTGFFQVPAASIVFCRAEGNYTHINTGDNEQLCTISLGHVHAIMPGNGFVRIGRSHLINTHYLYKVDRKACEVTFEKSGKFFSLTLPGRQIRELDKLI